MAAFRSQPLPAHSVIATALAAFCVAVPIPQANGYWVEECSGDPGPFPLPANPALDCALREVALDYGDAILGGYGQGEGGCGTRIAAPHTHTPQPCFICNQSR